MKKLNLICASIAVLLGANAHAGVLTTAVAGGTPFAIENFRGAAAGQELLNVTPGSISYSLSTITAVNGGGAQIFFTVRLVGAKFAAAPAIGTFSLAGTPLVAPGAGVAGGVVSLSTDRSTALVTITNNGPTLTLGLGAFSYTPAATNINDVNVTLSTVGGQATVSVGLTTVAPASLEATTALTTVDGPLPVAPIAVGAKAITGTVSALPTYTGRIDLTATPPGGTFTTGGFVALGSVTFTNNDTAPSNLQNIRSAASDYTLANGSAGTANTGMTVTITPAAGQSFPIGSALSLNTDVGCGAGTVVATTGTGTVVFTSVTALTAKVLTTAVAAVTTVPRFVCLSAPSAGNTATPLTATLAADVAEAAASDFVDVVTGTGFALNFNGSQVDVKNYFPNGLASFGYGSFIRINNTGTVAAVVSGAFINQLTGVVGGSFPLTGSMAAGSSVTLTGAAIEAVLGAPGSADRPRLRLTAPTNALQVQYYLQNPGGTITEISSQQ